MSDYRGAVTLLSIINYQLTINH